MLSFCYRNYYYQPIVKAENTPCVYLFSKLWFLEKYKMKSFQIPQGYDSFWRISMYTQSYSVEVSLPRTSSVYLEQVVDKLIKKVGTLNEGSYQTLTRSSDTGANVRDLRWENLSIKMSNCYWLKHIKYVRILEFMNP